MHAMAFKPNLTQNQYIFGNNLPQLKLCVVEDVNIYGITSSYDVGIKQTSQMLTSGPQGYSGIGMEVK